MSLTLGLGLGLTHQRPATGGEAPFSPDDIPGLALWLDASDESTIDDSTASPDVDSWTDKSSNGTVFSTVTTSRKPHTGATVNGLNAISFDGVDDLMVASSAASLTGTEGNFFIVYKVGNVADTQCLLSSSDTATNNKWITFQHRTSVRTIQQRDNDAAELMESDTAPVLDEVVLVMNSSDGSSYTMRRNGASEGFTVGNGSNNGDWFGDTTARDNIAVGSLRRIGPTNFLNADVCEILVYDGVSLSSGEIDQVEEYLADKWGITLA